MSSSEPSVATRWLSCASTVFDFGPDPVDLAEDLVQLDQVLDPLRPRLRTRGPVGQLLDPAQHAHGQRLAALRAAAAVLPGLRRLPVDAAGPVPVGVVLALLGEELERAGQAVRRLLTAK